MKNKQKLVILTIVLAVVMISCSFVNFNRGEDGNLRVETTISLDLIRTALETSAEFEQLVGLELEPRDGYIYVHADTVQIQGVTGQNVSFHLVLGASNGILTAQITDLQVNDNAFDTSQFDAYNQMIADNLSQFTEMTDRASLESVSVTSEGIKMVWILNTSSNS